MPRARNASFGTLEKVTVAIGSTSSNMRWILARGCGIGRHLLWSSQLFVRGLAPNDEQTRTTSAEPLSSVRRLGGPEFDTRTTNAVMRPRSIPPASLQVRATGSAVGDSTLRRQQGRGPLRSHANRRARLRISRAAYG